MNDPTYCPGCYSTNLIRRTGADEPTMHYGRITCGSCNKFIKWIGKPKRENTPDYWSDRGGELIGG